MKHYKIVSLALLGLFSVCSMVADYRRKSTLDLKVIKAGLLKKSKDSRISKKERDKAKREAQQISWILRDRE